MKYWPSWYQVLLTSVAKTLDDYNYLLRLESENASRHKVTAYGNAQLDGSGSCSFDGASGTGLELQSTENAHSPSSSGWAAHCYFTPTSLDGTTEMILSRYRTDTNKRCWYIAIDGATDVVKAYMTNDGIGGGGNEILLTGSTIITNSVEHHVALVQSGNDFYLWLDGALEATTNSAFTVLNSGTVVRVGCYATPTLALNFTGTIRRAVVERTDNGWTTPFTPPDGTIVPDENTALAINFEGSNGSTRILDSAKPSYDIGFASDDFESDRTVYIWANSDTQGTAEVSGGTYNFAVEAGNPKALGRRNSTLLVDGFRTTVKVTATNYFANTSTSQSISLQIVNSSSALQHQIFMTKSGASSTSVWRILVDNTDVTFSYPSDTIWFRISRPNGSSTVSFFYSTDGISFTNTGITRSSSIDLRTNLYMFSRWTGGNLSAQWDDFEQLDGSLEEIPVETDPGAVVGFCPDISGNENDGNPVNVTYDPFTPAYVFNGSNSYISLVNNIAEDSYMFGAISEADNPTLAGTVLFSGDKDSDNEHHYVGHNNNFMRYEARTLAEGIDAIQDPATVSGTHIMSALMKEADRKLYKNGVLVGASTANRPRNAWDTTEIGRTGRASATNYWNGKCAEILVSSTSSISDADRANIEQLLINKYSVS